MKCLALLWVASPRLKLYKGAYLNICTANLRRFEWVDRQRSISEFTANFEVGEISKDKKTPHLPRNAAIGWFHAQQAAIPCSPTVRFHPSPPDLIFPYANFEAGEISKDKKTPHLPFLAAARSQNGSDNRLGCHSVPFCRFATHWRTKETPHPPLKRSPFSHWRRLKCIKQKRHGEIRAFFFLQYISLQKRLPKGHLP